MIPVSIAVREQFCADVWLPETRRRIDCGISIAEVLKRTRVMTDYAFAVAMSSYKNRSEWIDALFEHYVTPVGCAC